MRLVDDWRKIHRHAASVRWMAAAIIFSGIEVAIPLLHDILPVSQGWFAALSSVSTMAALFFRFKSQPVFKEPT